MTALTVHLDDDLLQRTQEIAAERQSTIDDVVADALKEVSQSQAARPAIEETSEARRQRFERVFAKYAGHETGGPFTRDEMNER